MNQRLPTFIVIGAAKSGTTSLSEYLRAHPDVFMSTPKEPAFFSEHLHWGLEWYESLFADAGSAIARGEASTTYTMAPMHLNVPERMHDVVPDAKLIYLVRNPVERIRSKYAFSVMYQGERLPITEALRTKHLFIEESMYAFQLSNFLEHYSREQILVVTTDQLRDKRLAVLQRILTFIDADPTKPIDNLDEKFFPTVPFRRAPSWSNRAYGLAARTPLRHLPRGLKRGAYRATWWQRVEVPDTTLPDGLEDELWAELLPDLRRFREIVGPELSLWGRA